MFSKSAKKVRKGKLYCVSVKSSVPEDVPLLDNCMFELLHQIICSFKELFKVAVEARFHNSHYGYASIVILHRGYYEQVLKMIKTEEAIVFLKQMGGYENTNYTAFDTLWKNSIITLSTKNLVKIKDKMQNNPQSIKAELLIDEGEESVESLDFC